MLLYKKTFIKTNICGTVSISFFLCGVGQVRNEFYKDSQGVLLVYDVGLRESFDALDSWLGEMKQEMGSQANMDSIVFVVCANKVRLNPHSHTFIAVNRTCS